MREFAAMHHAATETFPTVVTAGQVGRLRRLAARFFSRGHARGSCDATFSFATEWRIVMRFIASSVGPMENRSSRAEQHQLLKKHILFSQLRDDELHEFLARSHIEQYAAKQEIFAKGSPGQSMMAVLRGSVKVSTWSPDGREVVFNTMEAGDIFGEIALLDGRERSADATALSDCEILVLYRRDFLPFLRRHPDLCIALLEVLCQRLRHTSEQVEDVLFETLGSRVAKLLLRLAHLEDGMREPAVRVTQGELGHMVGGARESVNRHLQAWQKAGLIEVLKGSIVIRDAGRLRRIV